MAGKGPDRPAGESGAEPSPAPRRDGANPATPRGGASSGSRFDQHVRRTEVLNLLRRSFSPLSITEIAEGVGIHPNTVRFHLDVLAEQGAVLRTMAGPAGRGRPRALYTARPGMDRAGTRRYQTLSRILVDSLAAGPAPERHAVEMGQVWGTRLVPDPPPCDAHPDESAEERGAHAVAALTTLLAELDFAPRHVPEPGTPGHLRLEHCPFLELAEEYGSVVCSLHFGLIQAALTKLGGPVRAAALQPFAEPGACLVRLAAE